MSTPFSHDRKHGTPPSLVRSLDKPVLAIYIKTIILRILISLMIAEFNCHFDEFNSYLQ